MQWIDIYVEDIHKNTGKYFIIKLFNLYPDEYSFDFDIVKFEQEQFVNSDGRPYYKKQISHWMPLPQPPKD